MKKVLAAEVEQTKFRLQALNRLGLDTNNKSEYEYLNLPGQDLDSICQRLCLEPCPVWGSLLRLDARGLRQRSRHLEARHCIGRATRRLGQNLKRTLKWTTAPFDLPLEGSA